jgi:hypothetical protein
MSTDLKLDVPYFREVAITIVLCYIHAHLNRKHCSYSFLTSVLDGVSGQRHAPAALYSRERPLVPTGQEGG